jgi:hypothetical protein
MERFYYKSKDNTGFLNLKSPLVDENYIQITEEEFNELTTPKIPELTAEQKAAQEKAKKIAEYKKYLQDTDYIAAKIAEANFNCDTEELVELHKQYDSVILQRKGWREAINKLEAN